MDVTKPYRFIGCGAMDVTNPSKFIKFGANPGLKSSTPLKENEGFHGSGGLESGSPGLTTLQGI